jgi:hypothetical protein
LLAYLEENTQGIEYLVAVPSSHQGSTLVLSSGRPVLFIGGFGGQDEVVNADDLHAMVMNGVLKYIRYGGARGNQEEIISWLEASCLIVPEFSSLGDQASQMQGPQNQQLTLYQCK